MPAILTHDLFGRESLDEVRDLLGFRTDDETDAFLLGNQGPDPLFYLVIDPLMRKWSPLGSAMHAARAMQARRPWRGPAAFTHFLPPACPALDYHGNVASPQREEPHG